MRIRRELGSNPQTPAGRPLHPRMRLGHTPNPSRKTSAPLSWDFAQPGSSYIVDETSDRDVPRHPGVGFDPLDLLAHVLLEVGEGIEAVGGNGGGAGGLTEPAVELLVFEE